jgi:hypothetical protein
LLDIQGIAILIEDRPNSSRLLIPDKQLAVEVSVRTGNRQLITLRPGRFRKLAKSCGCESAQAKYAGIGDHFTKVAGFLPG